MHDGPLYHTSYYAFLHTGLSGPAPGIAQGAIDHLITAIDGKLLMPQKQLQTDLARTHRQIGEAEGKVNAARLLLRDSADLIMGGAVAGRPLSPSERAHCRRNGNMSDLT